MAYKRNSRSGTKSRARTTSTESTDKTTVYQIVTDKVMDMLKAGTVPWAQPWHGGAGGGGLARSMSTRKAYRGINPLLLAVDAMTKGYVSPWWGTYNKIAELSGVDTKDRDAMRAWTGLRGQKSTMVVFWTRYQRTAEDPITGDKVKVPGFMLRYYNVFNAEQVAWPEGKVPAWMVVDASATLSEPERIDAAEKVVADYLATGPGVVFGGDRAFYSPQGDRITLPPREAFTTPAGLYWVFFHEMTHSTGHPDRLAREGVKDFDHFGSERYAKEELVAAMGAAMLSAMVGLDFTETIPDTAAYVASWLRALADDPKLVVQAAAQAQKAADRILGITFADDDSDAGGGA